MILTKYDKFQPHHRSLTPKTWPSPSCVMNIWRQRGFVLLQLIASLAPSSYAMSHEPKLEQKPWHKMHITKAPWKRDATCPTSYSSCPASLKGGCCPTDRSCGTDSCYATTSAPANACASSGYIACGIDQDGRPASR